MLSPDHASGGRHGLSSDEEKNSSSDNFEMHRELGGFKLEIIMMIAVVLIVFCSQNFNHAVQYCRLFPKTKQKNSACCKLRTIVYYQPTAKKEHPLSRIAWEYIIYSYQVLATFRFFPLALHYSNHCGQCQPECAPILRPYEQNPFQLSNEQRIKVRYIAIKIILLVLRPFSLRRSQDFNTARLALPPSCG